MSDFNGLNMHLGNLSLLSKAKTRSISAENMDGSKGNGAKAIPDKECPAYPLGKGWKVSPSVVINSGTTYTLANIDGPGAIQSMWMAGLLDKGLILRIYWDHQEQPSVECPLSDFFLCGWNTNKSHYHGNAFHQVNSLPVVVNPNQGLNCFFEMPFRKHCRMTLENRTSVDKVCYYQVNYTLTDIPDNAAYFHAQYRLSRPVKYKDVHTILDGVSGKGHYIGTALYVGLNRSSRWWGEGEIKFYLDDDEEYPTICGTGLEDYFGGAYNWDVQGKYAPYSTPFMGMPQIIYPDGTYEIQQRYSLYRWHIMDPIRFEEELKVTIQDLGWVTDDNGKSTFLPREDDFASIAYWYQTLPTAPFPELPPHEAFLDD